MPELIRRRARIEGHVQGVFFRQTCRREAAARDVAGWVRNLSDGSVEAVFEGTGGEVERMIEWCRRGPSGARVDRVDVFDEAPQGTVGFVIAR